MDFIKYLSSFIAKLICKLRLPFKRFYKAEKVEEFIKFGIVGSIGTLFNIFLLWLLTDIFNIYYLLSAIIVLEPSILFVFFFNDRWTWKDRKTSGIKNYLYRIFKYHIVSITSIIINLVLLWSLTEFLNIYYLISNLIGIIVGFLINYTINEKWTFNN